LQEFRDVSDPAADPGTVRRELSNSQEMILSNCCSRCSYGQIARNCRSARAVRQSFDHSQSSWGERRQDLQRRVESYLLVTSKADLTQQGIQQNFKPLLEDSEADQKR